MTSPEIPPLPPESVATRRFPRLIWVTAILVYAALMPKIVRSGGDVAYQAGRALGSILVAVLIAWGLWRIARRSTGAAWGGFLLGLLFALNGSVSADARERTATTCAFDEYAASSKRVNEAMLRFANTGGADLTTLDDIRSVDERKRQFGTMIDELHSLQEDLATGRRLRRALSDARATVDRIAALVAVHLATDDVVALRQVADAQLAWIEAIDMLREYAVRHRSCWSVGADGAMVIAKGTGGVVREQLESSVARAAETGKALNQLLQQLAVDSGSHSRSSSHGATPAGHTGASQSSPR